MSLLFIHSFSFVSKLFLSCLAPPHMPWIANALKCVTWSQPAISAEVRPAPISFLLTIKLNLAPALHAAQAHMWCNCMLDWRAAEL